LKEEYLMIIIDPEVIGRPCCGWKVIAVVADDTTNVGFKQIVTTVNGYAAKNPS